MNKYIKHFNTITKHKFVVMYYCFRCGLYKQGLLHDLSKYSLTEFFSSARYFNGKKSPIDCEKEDKGYSLAWQHHKGHNPHHWEYWIDEIGSSAKDNKPPKALKIPYKYVVEMICDWIGAGKVYNKGKWNQSMPYDYYNKGKDYYLLNNETRQLIEHFLVMIERYGLEKFIRIAKYNSYYTLDYQEIYYP